MIYYYNLDEEEINFLHFHGKSRIKYKNIIDFTIDNADLSKTYTSEISERVDFISVWTDDNECILKKQFDKFNIPLINAVPKEDLQKEWYMPNKIRYYINALENSTKDIVVLLDGYDIICASFNKLLEKFYKCNYNILFNTTSNNYPDVEIDIINNRDELGHYKYFNAGACIGYREDLLKFYKEALNFIDIDNPKNSELFIIRHAFAKYSNVDGNTFIGIDYGCNLFHTMGNTAIVWLSNNKFLII